MKLNLFKLFGVDVRLHWSWFLLLLIYIDFGTGWTSMLFDVLTLIMVFTFVLIHEFGHILAAKRYGVGTKYVVLNLFGGLALVDETMQDLTPKQQMWVVFAGPLTNIILFILFLPIAFYVANTSGDTLTELETLALVGLAVNFLMFVFNLLPIFPMDGGRLLRSILEHFKVSGAQYISIVVTQIFAVLLIIFSFKMGSIIAPIIAVLFFILALREKKTLRDEILQHEHDKTKKLLAEDQISLTEAIKRDEELFIAIKSYKIFFTTDYVQKRVSYGSTEDTE